MNISSSPLELNQYFKKPNYIHMLRTSPLIEVGFSDTNKLTFLQKIHNLTLVLNTNQDDDNLIPVILHIIDTIAIDGLDIKNELIKFANELMIEVLETNRIDRDLSASSNLNDIIQKQQKT
tara:strand:- start:264 stop:626 length:363 start_codon:yes stop_codon:yes gene_type:complete